MWPWSVRVAGVGDDSSLKKFSKAANLPSGLYAKTLIYDLPQLHSVMHVLETLWLSAENATQSGQSVQRPVPI